MIENHFFEGALAASLGAFVAAAELASRYRDSPRQAILSWPGCLYCLINALATLLALALLIIFQVDFGLKSDPGSLALVRGLLAGVNGLVILRSALFTVRLRDQDIPIGFAAFINILMQVVDQEVDRTRARDRAARVSKTMSGVEFDDVVMSLPAFAMALMQNLDEVQQAAVGEEINQLRNATEISERIRLLILGLYLSNAIGLDTLDVAVRSIKEQLDTRSTPS